MSRIIDFVHNDATRLDVSGGKGASLAKSARELPVPPGVIVTAAAYDEFLAPLRKQITGILREPSTEDASTAVQELVLATDFDPGWIADIDAALQRNELSDHAVAVRSSGTMEDLPGAAFAGQRRHVPGGAGRGVHRSRGAPLLRLPVERARDEVPRPAGTRPPPGVDGGRRPAHGRGERS